MSKDYTSTLNLPQTSFAMRANLPQREPDMLKYWEEIDLYHGMVEDEEKVERRKITIVKRLHMYLEEIMSNDLLTTSIIPIGDGVALSVKK